MNSHKITVYTPLQDFFFNTEMGANIAAIAAGGLVCFLISFGLYYLLMNGAAKIINRKGDYYKRLEYKRVIEKRICIISVFFCIFIFGLYIWWFFN
jgi:hypothetical protein